jgi:hypothetical protein
LPVTAGEVNEPATLPHGSLYMAGPTMPAPCGGVGRHCGGNAAQRKGCGQEPAAVTARKQAETGPKKIVAKNSKKFEIAVDTLKAPRLYTPHQRGRRAAGDEEVRF